MSADAGTDRGAGISSKVTLADGSAAEVRPLRSEDRPKVRALFESCGDDSLYTRFFTLGRNTVVRHIDHLFDESSPTRTYVLTRGDRIVGVADVEPCDDSTSEVAFLVADDAHGLGIATLLLERAADDARASGVDWFVADVLAVNHPMLEVFSDAGFDIERAPHHGEVALRMSTQLTEAARTAMAARHANALVRSRGRKDVGPVIPGKPTLNPS